MPSLVDRFKDNGSGCSLNVIQDIKNLGYVDGFTCLEVGSGDYTFVVGDK